MAERIHPFAKNKKDRPKLRTGRVEHVSPYTREGHRISGYSRPGKPKRSVPPYMTKRVHYNRYLTRDRYGRLVIAKKRIS